MILRRDGGAAVESLPPPSLGDEAVAVTILEPAAADVRTFTVEWRQGPYVGALTANGFDGRITRADVLALARAQADRIARN
ncbi:MAG TPA: hypothetical protein VF044_02585 [Actinomycetota bacterium]